MSTRVVIKYDPVLKFEGNLKQTIANIGNRLQEAVAEGTGLIYRRAVSETPVKTGRLQKHNIQITPLRGRISPSVKYGKWVHDGTGIYGEKKRPYTILPKKKGALAFKIGGKWVIVKKVTHPGIKPNPFYTRAVNATRPEVIEIFEKANVKILVEANQ